MIWAIIIVVLGIIGPAMYLLWVKKDKRRKDGKIIGDERWQRL